MKNFLDQHDLILTEAAIGGPLKEIYGVEPHPLLRHTTTVYSPEGIKAMTAIYAEYVAIAQKAKLPIVLFARTWRANSERVQAVSGMQDANKHAVEVLQNIKTELQASVPVKIGAYMACKNDAYKAQESLSAKEAEAFHAWQCEKLAETDADFIFPCTLPAVEEALGLSRAIAKIKMPYIVSFVINRNGQIFDGCSLSEAIDRIDNGVDQVPLGYMINCSYPDFLCADKQPLSVFKRLIGCQTNASSLDHHHLDGHAEMQADPVTQWGDEMLRLHKKFGLKILGGCCGTRAEHLEYLVKNLI